MMRALVPVDGSPNTQHAVRHVIRDFMKYPAMEVHLLNVQPPFSKHIAQFVSKKNRDAHHRDEAQKALRPIREMLDRFSVPYKVHTEVGSKAAVITDAARRLQCDSIVMGTARRNSLSRMFEASAINQVLELTTVRVEMIVGDEVSRLERYGLPAGVGAALAMLVAAAVD